MLKQKVLQRLRSGGGPLSGQQISRELGVSRAAVWKAVEALRREGYEIESVPRQGYRLLETTRSLCAAEILAALPADHPWRGQLQVMDSVDSTNTRAKALAAQGAPAGTVLIADHQTGGRGRLGRSFLSPAGVGIYLSAILRPQVRPEQLLHLTAMAAEYLSRAILEVCGVQPGIKWTNDLVLNRRKICGILTELSVEAESGLVQYVVVGIGVNCNQREFDDTIAAIATSLALETGREVDRNVLAAAMIRALEELSAALLTDTDWLRRYEAVCVTLGQEVKLVRGDEVRYAFAEGLDPAAALIVRYPDGSREAIACGEVSVRGMYGYT